MRRRRWVLLVTAAALGAIAPTTGAAATRDPSCRPVELRVALSPGGPEDQKVAGRLCEHRGTGGTLQVLLSGATYSSVYWDFPLDRARHSYVRAMGRAGHPVLSVDRVGTGRSSRPWPGSQVSFEANVHVVHQLVRAARRGALGGRGYDRVITVGHSLGAAAALVEAARHRDVDGLILTGFLAHAEPVGGPRTLASLYPAALDPRFGGAGPGYLTTRPQTRGDLFYQRAATSEAVIALDEATKDTTSPAELAGVMTQPGSPSVDEAIDVPVLSVVGEFDNLFCETSCAAPTSPAFREAARYPSAPSFDTHVQPGAGHVVNLHSNARSWFTAARGWLARRVARAPGGARPARAGQVQGPVAGSGGPESRRRRPS